MRVTLIHNPTAGSGDHESEHLVRALRRRGDDVTVVSKKSKHLGAAIRRENGELLVAAGGDGTIGKVIRAIAGEGNAPLLIVPLGTANNIARSLGITRRELDLDIVRRRWKKQIVDVARVKNEIVVEAAGCGVIAKFIRAASGKGRDGIRHEARSLADVVESAKLFDYRLEIDGEEIAGEALLIEAMLMRQMGPRVVLAPDGDPGDGLLDLVVVHEEERAAFARYLRSGDKRQLPNLTTHRASSVTIHSDARWHLDDEPVKRRSRTIDVQPRAWTALVPPQ